MNNFQKAQYRYDNMCPPDDDPPVCWLCDKECFSDEGIWDRLEDESGSRPIFICNECNGGEE